MVLLKILIKDAIIIAEKSGKNIWLSFNLTKVCFFITIKFNVQHTKYPMVLAIVKPYILILEDVTKRQVIATFKKMPINKFLVAFFVLSNACKIEFVIVTKHKKNISKLAYFNKLTAVSKLFKLNVG